MPFLFGGLFSTSVLVISNKFSQFDSYQFPPNFRLIFLSIIGVMIGGTLNQEILRTFEYLWVSISAIAIFVLIAHLANYLIFLYLGKYDQVTAFYAGAPGGLVESMTLGEEAGADLRILSIQHFIRIILVILIVPSAFFIWKGELFGSAGGLEFSKVQTKISDWVVIIILALVGIILSRIVKFPAKQFIVPLIIGATASIIDFPSFSNPNDLMNMCQLVIGTALGSRFIGITRHLIIRTVWLGFLSVIIMQLIGLLISLILTTLLDQDLEVFLICFTAGGVTEMSLMALSLSVSPIYVTAHHVFRIILTVIFMGLIKKHFRISS